VVPFRALFAPATRDRLASALGTAAAAGALERAIGTDLSVTGFAPRRHLPMRAGMAQGPGFPNLSCLGLLAARILTPYLRATA
jgi:mycobactin lysine-N-oxygenase